MSGVVAWLRLDGAPAMDDTFRRLMQASTYHGPDHSGTWSSGVIALGHHQLCTTPESERERQPISSIDGNVWATFDGRIDNRADLLPALSLGPPERVTDAALLLSAYDRWGVECVTHLIGDFGFALWDARARRLLCARDPLGIRPVFYAQHRGALAVATGLRELAASGCMPLEVNEGMVGEYLTGTVHSVTETLYRGALRLPAGHRLIADARGVRVSRYWRPDTVTELRVTRQEAAEHFRTLLFEAVRCRTRSQRPIAAHLSGGLDSSSIVSILGTLQAAGGLVQPFEAFSLTFPGMRCDETEYSQAVAQRYRPPWHRLAAKTLPAAEFQPLAGRYRDFPGYPNGPFAMSLIQRMQARQLRVALAGTGGDDLLGAASPTARILDLAPRGQWRTLKRELAGFSWPGMLAATARHLAMRGLDHFDVKAPRNAVVRRRLPPWLMSSFVQRAQLAERISELPPIPPCWSWSRARRLAAVDAGVRVHALEVEDRMNADQGIEVRHPFYDVRIVEFLLGLPEELCASQTTYKLVLRDAMRGVLPEQVRQRVSKAHFSHTFTECLGSEAVQRAFSRMGTAHAPAWIDGARARAALREQLADPESGNPWPLWGAYGIDAWWQLLPAHQPSIEPPPTAPSAPHRVPEEHVIVRG